MTETPTRFALLGTRDYVNGATLLSRFLELMESEGARDITVTRMKFLKVARANGRIVLSRNGPVPDVDTAHCILNAKADGEIWHGAFFDEGQPIEHAPAPASTVRDLQVQGFGGTCTLSPRDRASLIYDLVQANKRIHENAVEDASKAVVRFGYLEGWRVPPADQSFSGTLEIKNLIARRAPEGTLTINRITCMPDNGAPNTLNLCFEVAGGAAA